MECKRTNQGTRWFSSDWFWRTKIANWTADKDLVPSHNLCTCEPRWNIRFTRTYAVQKSHFWHDVHELSVTRNCKHFRRRPFGTLHATSWIWNFVCPVPVLNVQCRENKKSMKVQRCRQKPPPSSRNGSQTSDQRDQNFNHEQIVNEYKSLPSIALTLQVHCGRSMMWCKENHKQKVQTEQSTNG